MGFEEYSWKKSSGSESWRPRSNDSGRFNDRSRGGSFGASRGSRYGQSQGDWSEQRPHGIVNEPVEFEKCFYEPKRHIRNMSASEISRFREEAGMRVKGEDVPQPIKEFEDIDFPGFVFDIFRKRGYEGPTPIQAQGWPMALSGRDMVGIAQTGSGKTISFALPGLIHVSKQPRLRVGDGPIMLVLAPTRELCLQINEEINAFAGKFGLKTLSIYGGVSSNPQKTALYNGVEVLVATPGRLIDMIEQGFCPLNRVSFLVLDEADRMLDMGFKPQLERIIPKTNPKRQTLMWSATWPIEVRRLANDYMDTYIQVNIGSEELTTNSNIIQKIELTDSYNKQSRLQELLSHDDKVIIFANMKRTCDELENLLGRKFKVAAIHGDKSQHIRDRIIVDFKSGYRNILIATDVAARGLDVKDVKLVINYDFPNNCDDYVHRIGRTARGAEKEGHAITFFTKNDSSNASELVKLLRSAKQPVPDELSRMADEVSGVRVSRFSRQSRSFGGRSNYGGGYSSGRW